MTITWRGRKSGSVSLFCHYLFGQREQRWLLLYDLAQRAPHPAVRRHRARLSERLRGNAGQAGGHGSHDLRDHRRDAVGHWGGQVRQGAPGPQL